jgi:hypothetical protein
MPRPAACLAARLAVLAVLAASAGLPAVAGPIADAARDAERLLAQGKADEAAAALDKARDRLWRDAPLAVRHLQFVTAAPQGFGVYDPRKAGAFKSGETLYVYGEVIGYGYGRDRDQVRIEFDVTLSATDADGDGVIAPQSGRLAQTSRAENREYMLALVYEPKGLPAGDYVLVAELKDLNSGKTTTVKLPFRIA